MQFGEEISPHANRGGGIASLSSGFSLLPRVQIYHASLSSSLRSQIRDVMAPGAGMRMREDSGVVSRDHHINEASVVRDRACAREREKRQAAFYGREIAADKSLRISLAWLHLPPHVPRFDDK